MARHDGLTACLVEEAGFDAVWASGFEISASHVLPDASILTMTDMMAVARQIEKSTTLPVIADCDDGFGNAIDVIQLVRAYERAAIAVLCIEDSPFPKRCSFYDDEVRRLVSIDEQARNIRAPVDARSNPRTVIIARTEALIAEQRVD